VKSLTIGIALSAFIGIGHASAGGTPVGQRKGVLPLRLGIYVEERSSCGDPANAAILKYDGKGIGSSNTHGCKAKISKRNGSSLTISQTCIDAGAGAGPRISEEFKLTAQSGTEFTIAKNTKANTYRFCTPSSLPAGIR
jgi:hypothetical protein